ncbi:hypothetical protein K402DRAFT_393121 [Aulographum hederae CBS 113979]|uniref:Nuclear matrix protein n=1 Tax=Aulographum hederae CBS 113979 TaxID=1176131 RepID=A0A6G1H1P0_9PEZI|nr:hypothetical protein K402DRAFT_393121 [Aulographum hederae CBS 113979]
MAISPRLIAAETTYTRLEELLARASAIKTSTEIEPPLPESEFTGDKGLINRSDVSTQLHNHLVDAAAHRILLETLFSASVEDPSFVRIWNLLDILSICGDQDQCENTVAWRLIEELFEAQSIYGCSKVFDYLESRRERLVETNFRTKFTITLRSCNELLERLSRAEDTVFCGRVFIFLFQSFPLGDKSSLNLKGEFHTGNVTTYEQLPTPEPEPQSMQIDEAPSAPTNGVKKEPSNVKQEGDSGVTVKVSDVDDVKEPAALSLDELYPRFWSLQHAFSNPPVLFVDGALDIFKTNFEHTLEAFKHAKVIPTRVTEANRRRQLDSEDPGTTSNFNPKYLTSRDLFDLELSDPAFQRHILVQGLIQIQFLMSLTEKAKQKAPKTNRAVQFDFTLSEENAEWAIHTKKKIEDYLKSRDDGAIYCRMVDTVLSRDKNWTRWKQEGCPEIKRPPVEMAEILQARAMSSKPPKRVRATPLGQMDLSFLTDAGGAMEKLMLKDTPSFSVPSESAAFENAQPTEMSLDWAAPTIDGHERTDQEDAAQWRALRTIAATKLHLLDRPGSDGRLLLKQGGLGNPEAPEEQQEGDGPTASEAAVDDSTMEGHDDPHAEASAGEEQREQGSHVEASSHGGEQGTEAAVMD